MLRYIRGRIRIPDEIVLREEAIILHITDTPKVIFRAMNELIKIIHPEYIIHTGDLVDNLKLENYKGLEPLYEKAVIDIIDIVKSSEIMSYIVLGNHDLKKVKDFESEKLTVFDKPFEVNIEGLKIKMSHKYSSGFEGFCISFELNVFLKKEDKSIVIFLANSGSVKVNALIEFRELQIKCGLI